MQLAYVASIVATKMLNAALDVAHELKHEHGLSDEEHQAICLKIFAADKAFNVNEVLVS